MLSQVRCLQLFKMARNCLDRGEKIYTTAKQEQRPLALFRLASPSPTTSPTLLTPPLDNGKVEERGYWLSGVWLSGVLALAEGALVKSEQYWWGGIGEGVIDEGVLVRGLLMRGHWWRVKSIDDGGIGEEWRVLMRGYWWGGYWWRVKSIDEGGIGEEWRVLMRGYWWGGLVEGKIGEGIIYIALVSLSTAVHDRQVCV